MVRLLMALAMKSISASGKRDNPYGYGLKCFRIIKIERRKLATTQTINSQDVEGPMLFRNISTIEELMEMPDSYVCMRRLAGAIEALCSDVYS